VAELNDVQLAFLFGFANGYRCARLELQQDAENLVAKMKKEVRAEIHATREALARWEMPSMGGRRTRY